MRRVRQVSFNLEDDFENKLHAYADAQGAFSKYIKRLITRDYENKPVHREAYVEPTSKAVKRRDVSSFV